MNQLLNQDGLTDTGTTEQTNLTTLCIWGKQINNLDTGFQHLNNRALVFKCWRLTVDTPMLTILQTFLSIQCLTKYIEQPS